METIRKAIAQIEYESKDITKYVKPYLMSVTYTDYEHGQSDELEIQLDNSDGLWHSKWYPVKGDVIRAKIGYEGATLLDCGTFEIDEIEGGFGPDTLTIKALATSIKKPVRQKNTVAYENKTLVDIAKIIGKKHGFKVAGSQGFIKINRATQKKETDLEFLKRKAEEYGYIFKIANNILTFYKLETLESKKSLFSLKKSDLIPGSSLTDKTSGVYSGCTVQYFDPNRKKMHKVTVHSDKAVKKGDILKITRRCESKSQAKLQAKAALARKSGIRIEGNLSFEGNVKAIAGINFDLSEAKKFSGTYHIETSRHVISPTDGYKTDIDVKRIG